MTTKLKPIADSAARAYPYVDTLPHDEGTRFEVMRDWLDTRTGGDLDPHALDILTDMVLARLAKEPCS